MRLSDFDPRRIRDLLNDLKNEATGFVRSCDETSDILSQFKAYMRYSGQGWEIPIDLTEDQAMHPDAAIFQTRFEDEYTKLFGRVVASMDIEITVWAVNATTPPKAVDRVGPMQGDIEPKPQKTRPLFDPALGDYLDAQVVGRTHMTPGQRACGPAAITENETTIIIPASRDAICQPDGCIDVVMKGQTP
jgi:N-methylhydantoinase A